MEAKYKHTNIVASDWRKLAGFYRKVFGCKPVPWRGRPGLASRRHSFGCAQDRPASGREQGQDALATLAAVGKWVERCTGVPGAEVRGVHLRLPGYGNDGPTLEIFQYNKAEQRPATAINRPGLAHLAFEVDDVEAARDEVIAAGGRCVGELVTVEIHGAGTITFIYVTYPGGNIIELQKWVSSKRAMTPG